MNAAARQYARPPKWTDEQLGGAAARQSRDFIAARRPRGALAYQAVFAARMHDVETLFSATDNLLDFASGRALANDPALIEVARYLAAPPISGGDLQPPWLGAMSRPRKKLDADLLGEKAPLITSSQRPPSPEQFPAYSDPPLAPRPNGGAPVGDKVDGRSQKPQRGLKLAVGARLRAARSEWSASSCCPSASSRSRRDRSSSPAG